MAIAERHRQEPTDHEAEEAGVSRPARTARDARAAWRSEARIEQMFWRSVDLAGTGWIGHRAVVHCCACFREVSTEPLPVSTNSGDARMALYAAFATHATEKCEPVRYDRRDR
jgi:hypothetical protein